jgi:4,5-dihydroxyphthalate decarboxylase
MSKLTLSLAGVSYDRTRVLFDGTMEIEGCEIIPLPMSPEQAFYRAFRFQEFDITELSLSSYMNVLDRMGNDSDYVAIPVFPSRLFRHSSIYIRTDRGINRPEDLTGKLVGVPEYQMTAAVWIRGILQDQYSVRPTDVRWRTGGLEEAGREEKSKLSLTGLDLHSIPPTETLSGQLNEGKIDALISALAPSCFGNNLNVTRLFPNYRDVEEAYYTATGIFPIMHVVGIRRRLVEAHPWLAVNTFMAYLRAKEICYRNMEKIGHLFTTLPWPIDDLQRARALMGDDFWSYGVEKNFLTLEAITRYAHEQGLTSRRFAPEDLFVPSTLQLVKV